MIEFNMKELAQRKLSEKSVGTLDLISSGRSAEYAAAYTRCAHDEGKPDEYAHMYALAFEEYHRTLRDYLQESGCYAMTFVEQQLTDGYREDAARLMLEFMCRDYGHSYAAAYAEASLSDNSHEYCQAYGSAMAQGHSEDFARGAGHQAELQRGTRGFQLAA